MARKDRFETVYDGSVQHITQRGLNRSGTFKSDEDYLKFNRLIRRYLLEYHIKIYNYCLMPNHFHILTLIEEAAHLSKFMQSVQLSYGAYFRDKYNYTGYMWQGRFKNFPIDKNSYLLECARYIERNPLRGNNKLVDDLSEYRWSSYNYYENGKQDDLITINPMYETIGKTIKERRNNYKEYVLTPRPYEEALDDLDPIPIN